MHRQWLGRATTTTSARSRRRSQTTGIHAVQRFIHPLHPRSFQSPLQLFLTSQVRRPAQWPYQQASFRIRHLSSSVHDKTGEPKDESIVAVAAVDTEDKEDSDNDDDESSSNVVSPIGDYNSNVYRSTLNNWYRANFDVSLNDAFQCQSQKIHPELNQKLQRSIEWTCNFTCPVTGHRIETFIRDSDNVHLLFFDTKKEAMQATAEQAVKYFCILDQDENIDENNDDEIDTSSSSSSKVENLSDASKRGGVIARKRLQLIYMKNYKRALVDEDFHFIKTNRSGKKHGGTWWTASFHCPVTSKVFPAMKSPQHEHCADLGDGKTWYRRKGDSLQAACEHALWAIQTGTAGISRDEYNNVYEAITSTDPLKVWYRKHYSNLEITNDNFVVSSTSWAGSGGTLWTATFICPVTANRYDAGSLKSLEPAGSHGHIHWYRRKNDAIFAAALRAYDVLVFQATGMADPRFCLEDPSSTADFSSSPLSPQDPKDTSSANDETNDLPSIHQEVAPSEDYQQAQPASSFGLDQSGVVDENKGNVNDEEDDFVLEFVPRRIGNPMGVASAPTTLDLVAETWIQNGLQPPSASIPEQPNGGLMAVSSTPKQQCDDAIARAHKWLALQRQPLEDDDGTTDPDRSRFDTAGSVTSTRITAKRLLQSLALANYRQDAGGKDSSGVEDAAKAILDFLWSSPTTAPDADCFALYIQCLEGGHTSVLRKAANIYNAMASGSKFEGHSVPPPNTFVFNTLVQRRAEFGVKTSLSELEGIETNRETFLSCLSVLAHATGQGKRGFDDVQYVLNCINALKEKYEETKDPCMKVDIDVYNAPMRWSGPPAKSALTRPYSRHIPWDDHTTLASSSQGFTKVFSDNDPAVQEAKAMENWFDSINARAFGADIQANVESFESVIQAWIRTGTLEGLKHAERILGILRERILDTSSSDRLKILSRTVHPFLSALCRAGDIERVDKWAMILETAGEGTHDSRLTAARILARVVAPANGGGSFRGHSALELLKESVDKVQTNGNLVEAHGFTMTIEAFKRQASEDRQSTSEAVKGIQDTLALFDELLASSLGRSSSESVAQQLHLMHHAPAVYAAAFMAVCDLHLDGQSAICSCLDWGEKVIRRSGEHIVLSRNAQSSPCHVGPADGELVYEDSFCYRFGHCLGTGGSNSWKDFHISVIDTVSKLYPLHQRRLNECLRLMVLASRALQGSPDTGENEVEAAFKDKVSPHIQREFGIASIDQSGSDKVDYRRQGSDESSNSVIKARHAYEQRRKKREEKKGKVPSRRPRKASLAAAQSR